MMTQTISRSQSLDQLRGISALLVVFYHFAIFFFTDQAFSARLCHVAPIDFSSFSFIETMKGLAPFDLGAFAVSLFFLLSGFFTPALLERYPTPWTFLFNRFFRLMPTYSVALLINLTFLISLALYSQGEFPYTIGHLLSVLTLTRDIFGYPLIDGVIWTLEIEWKFCLFCVCFFPLIKNADFKRVLIWQNSIFFVFWVIYAFLRNNEIEDMPLLMSFSRSIINNIKFFSFLLIGSVFYFYQQQKMDKKTFQSFLALLIFLFTLQSFMMLNEKAFWRYTVSYLPAIAVFAFVLQRKNKPSNTIFSRFLDFATQISYPLYLIHAMSGYAIVYFLYSQGISLFVGMFVALMFSVVSAYLLHRFIEQPSHTFARSRTVKIA